MNPAKVWTTGDSNGGQYSWELATNSRTAPIFSAILPSIGSQMLGYLLPPQRTVNLTVVGMWGIFDKIIVSLTVSPSHSPSSPPVLLRVAER